MRTWLAVLAVCGVAAFGSVAAALEDAHEYTPEVQFNIGNGPRELTHCNDLAGRREARRFLESLPGNRGVERRLDPDRDGRPCEGTRY